MDPISALKRGFLAIEKRLPQCLFQLAWPSARSSWYNAMLPSQDCRTLVAALLLFEEAIRSVVCQENGVQGTGYGIWGWVEGLTE